MEEMKPAKLLKVTLFHAFYVRSFKLYRWYQIAQNIAYVCF